MAMEMKVSDFITGKFNEIKARVPVKLSGFLTAESFESQLAVSASELETSSAEKPLPESGNDANQNLTFSNMTIFPNIIPAQEEPEAADDVQTTASAEAGTGFETDTENGAVNDTDDIYDADMYDYGIYENDIYDDNFYEYGINDEDWNAEAWDNYGVYGDIADDDYLYDNEWDDDEYYIEPYEDAAGIYGGADSEYDANINGNGITDWQIPVNYIDSYGGGTMREAIENTIIGASTRYGIDPNLIRAIISQESGFIPSSLSSAGAQGLMQLMPETAVSLGVYNPWDIGENINGGTKLLRGYLENYRGDLVMALAAYNAGPGAVQRYNGVPPYTETQEYVKRVIESYKRYSAGDI